MKGAWLALALGAVAGAVALGVARRLPPRPAAPAVHATVAPAETLVVTLAGGRVTPERAEAGLGHRLRLTIVNRGPDSARVALSGYEHRFAGVALAPGGSWSGTIALDLPGDDFAWLVDGEPLARLRVAGSHLVEGHR